MGGDMGAEMEVDLKGGTVQGSLLNLDASVEDLTLGFLASLTIDFPERGQDFYFSSPRGNAQVSARPIHHQTFNLGITGIGIVGWLLGCWICIKICRSIHHSIVLRTLVVLLLGFAGVVSVGSGGLPILGLMAVVTSFVLAFYWIFVGTVELEQSPAR